jgi:hypothetical protein
MSGDLFPAATSEGLAALFDLEEVATMQTHLLIDICMWVYHFRLLNARKQSPIDTFCGLDSKVQIETNSYYTQMAAETVT